MAKIILNGIDYTGVSGVKGNNETEYRKGEVNITPDNIGAATSDHTHAQLIYSETRPVSADKTSTSDKIGSIEAFVASSSMTTGKPASDGKILQMNWDNTSGWDSQLAMLNNGYLQHRNMASGTWQTWRTILDSSNYTNYVDNALSTTSTNPVQNKVVNTAIEEVKKSVSDGKSTVASAITNMGVSTASDATFATMATNVKKIFPTPTQFAAKYKNVFRSLATAPVNFNGATAICYGKQIFVHGSCASGGDFKSMYCYDIVSNTWSKMASSPVEHQWLNTAVLVGDSILYFGNWTGTSINLYQYNISWNTWTNRNVSIPIAAQGGAAFFQGGAIRLLSSQYTSYKNNYYYYSLIYNTFTQGATLTDSDAADIYGCTSVPITVGDKVYLISHASAKIKIFHVGNFKTVEDIVSPGSSFGCATKVGNLIYMACVKATNTPYIFNISTKTFTKLYADHYGHDASCVNFGDEVFYIGSSESGHENKATNIHTTFCLDNLY